MATMLPTIGSLNGTSADELFRQRQEYGIALQEAAQKFAECYPNGRDYIGHDIKAATTEHLRRGEMLRELVAINLEEIERCLDEIDRRETRRLENIEITNNLNTKK